MAQRSGTETAGIKSSEDIREDLECPICFKIPRTTPIYQCEQGHIHCKTCHSRLQNCPVCRGPIGNTRNLVVEKIISKLPVKCINFENGCQEPQALPDQIIEHEKYCEFRMVKCFFSGCKDSFIINNPEDHLKKHPRVILDVGSRAIRNFSAKKHYGLLMHFKDKKFGVSHVLDSAGCQVTKVFFIGSPIMAKQFRCKIIVSSTKVDNDFKMTFERTISAYGSALSDIPTCSSVDPKTLREIVNEENRYWIDISIISKTKDEPKCKRQRLQNESTPAPPAGSHFSNEERENHPNPTGGNETIVIDSDDE